MLKKIKYLYFLSIFIIIIILLTEMILIYYYISKNNIYVVTVMYRGIFKLDFDKYSAGKLSYMTDLSSNLYHY